MNPVVPKANKGEWSELYVLFKILCDRRIPAAGPDLQTIPGGQYNFLKIYREEVPGQIYQYNLEQEGVVRILDTQGNEIKAISTTGLSAQAAAILEAIRQAATSTFEMPSLAGLMEDYLITKVKANSLEKTDLLAVVEGRDNQLDPKLGFSVKSHIGGSPTLVNPSSHTNFIYEVTGFDQDIDGINSIEGAGKVQKRLAAIRQAGGQLQFQRVSSGTFNTNMRFTDTLLPDIMSRMMLEYYSGNGAKWSDLVKLVANHDDLDASEAELTYKLKGFLRSIALGMVPGTIWDTNLKSYGGYIVVLPDGQVVCYNLVQDDEFKEYLFRHTKLDTPSTTRFGFGSLYRQDDKLLFNLNMQVRFLK